MEWHDTDDRRLFAETAERFGLWTQKAVSEDTLHERSVPASFNRELVAEAARAGLIAAPLPESIGGAGLDLLGQAIALERVARGRAGVAAILAVHWAGLAPILPPGSEAEAGLLEAFGRAVGDRPVLWGAVIPAAVIETSASWPKAVSSGAADAPTRIAGSFLAPLCPELCAQVALSVPLENGDALFAVQPGSSLARFYARADPGSGLLEVPTARLELAGLELKGGLTLTGPRAKAAVVRLQRALYLGLASVMVGNAAAASAYAWGYAAERVQTGRPIIEHMDVRRALERMETLVEAARATVFSAAALLDDPLALRRARRASLFAGDAGEEVCLDAVQCLGGYGYMEDYGLERRLRDHKTLQCLMGAQALDWIGAGCWPDL